MYKQEIIVKPFKPLILRIVGNPYFVIAIVLIALFFNKG